MKDTRVRTYSAYIASVAVCTLLALALLPLAAQGATLPPPPPPPEPQIAQRAPVSGAPAELRVQFSQAWPWATVPWQGLWTAVQHQKSVGGDWYDVVGWRGGLDAVAVGADGKITGQKTWWVAGEDLGRGTYRWLVYRGEGGDLLATSAPFYLPHAAGEPVTVEVPLAP